LDKKPNIALLTHEFPFGNSETSFIDPELTFLNECFNLSHVFTFPGGDLTTELDQSAQIFKFSDGYNSKVSWSVKLRFFLTILFPFLVFNSKNLLFKSSMSDRKMVISQFVKHYRMSLFIHHKIGNMPVDILYSYWFDHWNVAACIYKQLFNPKVKIVSRVHRYEIDLNTSKRAYFPFHKFQIKYSDLLGFISTTWRKRMALRHPRYASKMKVHQMGVDDSDLPILEPQHPPYHLLSISGNIPVKRMDIQAEAINQLDLPVVWHHFGMDKADRSILNQITSDQVEYINHGFVPIQELHNWLGQNTIHFMLNSSSVEGVPVSMMECISYGIPIMAIDVGGVSEIVSKATGVLCDADAEASLFAQTLKEQLVQYSFHGAKREGVLKVQRDSFSNKKNHTNFFNKLIDLLRE